MEDMQTENEALNCETEYLRGQCNDVATIEEQLKTVTAEQQRLKEVRDHMQLEMENFRDQCKDTAALADKGTNLYYKANVRQGIQRP
jgi:predicted nuclease with TOPRIM domain